MKTLLFACFALFLFSSVNAQDFYNIYFDFNKSNIRTGAEDTLKMVLKTLQDYPQLVVEVRGHADAIGADGYNYRLSAHRSSATIDYLAKAGIDKSRLVLKAFGEKDPAAENTTEDGKDNPEGRQLNRRVEFKIVDVNRDVSEGNNYDAPNVQTMEDDTYIPKSSDENDNEEMHTVTVEGGSTGVFKAPANVSVSSVVSPSMNIPAIEQGELKPILLETPSEPGCDCGFDFQSATKAELKLYRRARLSERTMSTNQVETQCLNLCILKALAAEGNYQEAEKGLRNLQASERRLNVKQRGR